MRRHVKRVRGRWSDPGIRTRRSQSPWREFCAVVGVDQVVSQPGVLGLLAKDGFENLGGSFLIPMRFVGRRRRRNEGKRVEDLRLGITRIVSSDVGHGTRIPFCACRRCLLIGVTIVRVQSLDELALT